MDMVLTIVGWSAFGLAILAGMLLNVLGLFGNWLILLAVVAAWVLTGFTSFGPWAIGGMLAIALLGEVLEMALAGYGAKRFGGSKGSMVAALVGCIVGGILGSPWIPVFGTLAGACVGAFVGAALYEYLHHQKEVQASLWTGFGAGVGKIGGIAAKFCCGLAIVAIAAFTY